MKGNELITNIINSFFNGSDPLALVEQCHAGMLWEAIKRENAHDIEVHNIFAHLLLHDEFFLPRQGTVLCLDTQQGQKKGRQLRPYPRHSEPAERAWESVLSTCLVGAIINRPWAVIDRPYSKNEPKDREPSPVFLSSNDSTTILDRIIMTWR